MTINYVVGSCSYTCYEEGELTPSGHTSVTPVTYSCGTNCCKVTRNYVKLNGEFVPSTPLEIFEPNEQCESTNVTCFEGGAPSCTGGCDELSAF
jgi:hypothetical protein